MNSAIMDLIRNLDNPDNIIEEKRRINLLREKGKLLILRHLNKQLSNLTMSYYDTFEKEKIMELSKAGYLEGWCRESADFACFFLDKSIVARGNLSFYERNIYHHSWVEFPYREEVYVFDGPLHIFCDKESYYQIFQAEAEAKISAELINLAIIEKIQQKQERDAKQSKIMTFLDSVLLKERENLTPIVGSYKIDDCFYRTNAGVEAIIEGAQIKKLHARLYTDA